VSHIHLLDKTLDSYKSWLSNLESILVEIEENILQKDDTDKVEEKLVSIGISTVFVYIGSGIATLVGIGAAGIVGGIILFGIGWFLSQGINRKVFGKIRSRDSISSEESSLLNESEEILKYFKPITLQLKFKKKSVNFDNYLDLKQKFKDMELKISNYNASKLALKYRYRHSKIVKKYIILSHKFDEIYANKKVKRF
jgi:hypothetical protein